MIINDMDIGKVIKDRRRALGYTQKQFGEMVNKSNTYISDIEVGRVNPSINTLLSFLKILKLELVLKEANQKRNK